MQKINKQLQDQGIDTWVDYEKMTGSLVDASIYNIIFQIGLTIQISGFCCREFYCNHYLRE